MEIEREGGGGGGGTPYHLILDAITNHNFVDPTMSLKGRGRCCRALSYS